MEDLEMNKNFWKGKRVLITGHTGFKGSWLSLWLQTLGAKLSGLSLENHSSPNMFDLCNIGASMDNFMGDIKDFDFVYGSVSKIRPEIVIHMAAQSLVRYSYQNPIETYATNIMGTVNLFESLRKIGGVKSIINVTSDKCYENKEWLWGYRENERLGGYDPYSNSKACSELVTSAYRLSFYQDLGIGLASARAGNVIGGGDWSTNRLIPDVIKSFIENKSVVIRSPNAIRPWQHVLEPLSGYLTLAEALWKDRVSYEQAWNFGPKVEDCKPVSWIVDNLSKLWGVDAKWSIDIESHHHEAKYLKLDATKARELLSWNQKWDIQEGLEKSFSWYKAWLSGHDLNYFTLQQINEYMASKP
jgi:CDP-glucose 4,6-dehydratase